MTPWPMTMWSWWMAMVVLAILVTHGRSRPKKKPQTLAVVCWKKHLISLDSMGYRVPTLTLPSHLLDDADARKWEEAIMLTEAWHGLLKRMAPQAFLSQLLALVETHPEAMCSLYMRAGAKQDHEWSVHSWLLGFQERDGCRETFRCMRDEPLFSRWLELGAHKTMNVCWDALHSTLGKGAITPEAVRAMACMPSMLGEEDGQEWWAAQEKRRMELALPLVERGGVKHKPRM